METATATVSPVQSGSTAPIKVGTIQSSINESAYFRSMRHAFKTSSSFLGELMQNSRRAGATFVSFDLQAQARNLTIEDDGAGIQDFAKLVQLCESSWETDVMLADNPFGQGFFSVFFACEQVTVRSRGLRATICFDEIAKKRPIEVLTDTNGPKSGTRLEMVGLDSKLLGKQNQYDPALKKHVERLDIESKVRSLARGFSIDVRYEGKSLDRPHAQSNLQGEQTQLGFISCGHVHDDRTVLMIPEKTINGGSMNGDWALYLQGLPIQFSSSYGNEKCIVHLDTHMFAPVLPDRAYIYDADKKLPLLSGAVKQMCVDFLARKKAAVSAEEFTRTYWGAAKGLGCMAMFNDIPLLPKSICSGIAQVAMANDDRYGPPAFTGDFLTLENIQTGKVVVWRDEPFNVTEDPHVGPILKVMELKEITCIEDAGLDPDHWIFKYTPSCTDMEASVKLNTELGEEPFYAGNSEMDLKLVDSFTITLTLNNDPTWSVEVVVNDDWVIQAIDTESEDVICYLCQNDTSIDWPLMALTDCTDEYDKYDEDWHDRLIASWNSLINGMKGRNLAFSVGSEFNRIQVIITDTQLGQMVLLTAVRPANYNYLSVFDLESPEFWDKFAGSLTGQSELNGANLKALFAQAAKPEAPQETPKEQV